jgi:hypothetical protein
VVVTARFKVKGQDTDTNWHYPEGDREYGYVNPWIGGGEWEWGGGLVGVSCRASERRKKEDGDRR